MKGTPVNITSVIKLFFRTAKPPLEMLEIFKTNVRKVSQAKKLVILLLDHFPGAKINFDLKDCDNILRVEAKDFVPEKVMHLVKENGFTCNVLE